MRLRSRLLVAAVVAAATFAAAAAAAALSAQALAQALLEAAEARFAVGLDQVRRNIEAELTLGLPLSAVTAADANFDAALADPNATAVELFDASGVILLSTDVSFIGDLAAERDMAAFQSGGDAIFWTTNRDDAVQPKIGMTVRNAHDGVVGAVTLSYAPGAVTAVLDRRRDQAMAAIAAAAAISGVLTFLFAHLAARRSAHAAAAIDRLHHGEDADAPEDARAAYGRLQSVDKLLTDLCEGIRRVAR